MGLIKFLEKRKEEGRKSQEAEAIYKREREQAFQQGLRQGKITGAYAQGLKTGRKEAAKPSGGRGVLNILGGLGEASQRMEQNLFPEFSGLDPFGSAPKKHTKKKHKGKGKTIVIHVK